MSPDPLASIIRSQRRVQTLDAQLARARDERDERIRAALAAGIGATEISRAVGVSRPFVHRIARHGRSSGSVNPFGAA